MEIIKEVTMAPSLKEVSFDNLKRGQVLAQKSAVTSDANIVFMIHSLEYGLKHHKHAVAVSLTSTERYTYKELKDLFNEVGPWVRGQIKGTTSSTVVEEVTLSDVPEYTYTIIRPKVSCEPFKKGCIYIADDTYIPYLCIHDEEFGYKYPDTAILVQLTTKGDRLTASNYGSFTFECANLDSLTIKF